MDEKLNDFLSLAYPPGPLSVPDRPPLEVEVVPIVGVSDGQVVGVRVGVLRRGPDGRASPTSAGFKLRPQTLRRLAEALNAMADRLGVDP
jgi:hypothetical protein